MKTVIRFLVAVAGCAVLLLATPGLSFAQDKPPLGLADRRALADYQAKAYPAHEAAIRAAAGFEVPIEVEWTKIAGPGEGERYASDDYWTSIFFVPLETAIKGITVDDLGKEAIKAGLKKIVVTFDDATAPASNYPNGVTFEGGTLTVNFRPYSNVADVTDRADAIRKALEAGL